MPFNIDKIDALAIEMQKNRVMIFFQKKGESIVQLTTYESTGEIIPNFGIKFVIKKTEWQDHHEEILLHIKYRPHHIQNAFNAYVSFL